MSALRAPFPWFGGKRRVAPEVWERFGDVPDYGWTAHAWKAAGGYGGGRGGVGDENRHKERIYFSPACIDLSVPDLFTEMGA